MAGREVPHHRYDELPTLQYILSEWSDLSQKHIADCLVEDKRELEPLMKLLEDCEEICFDTLCVLNRKSNYGIDFLQLCIKICNDCADECDKFPYNHCKECAIGCRKCAEACQMAVKEFQQK